MGLFDWMKAKKPEPGAWKPHVKAEPAKAPDPKPVSLGELRPEILKHLKSGWKPIVTSGEGHPSASRFGGAPGLLSGEEWPACGMCKKPMNFFFQMNLEKVPGSFGKGLLQFFYCLSDGCEGGWEAFSSNHRVRVVDPGQVERPGVVPIEKPFPAKQVTDWTEIRELPSWEELGDMGIEVTPVEERSLEAADVPKAGDKLGGWPSWVQGVEYPKCTACGNRMTLVFQIDSEDNVPYMWGDVGCGHVTRCPDHPDVLAYAWACC